MRKYESKVPSTVGKVLLVKKPEKIIDLVQVVEKLSHNVVSNTPRLSGVPPHNFSGGRH